MCGQRIARCVRGLTGVSLRCALDQGPTPQGGPGRRIGGSVATAASPATPIASAGHATRASFGASCAVATASVAAITLEATTVPSFSYSTSRPACTDASAEPATITIAASCSASEATISSSRANSTELSAIAPGRAR